MNHKIIIFYLLVTLVLGVKVGVTLFEHSSNIHHGHQIANLQSQHHILQSQKQLITQQLAEKAALTDISQNLDQREFLAISTPIVISPPKQLVASGI